MDCPNCGNPIRPEAVYCPRCGAKIDAPPPRGDAVADLDATAFDRALLDQLTKSGLDAHEAGDGKLTTGIEGLELDRGSVEVLQLNDPAPEGAFEASAEIAANLQHSQFGEASVTDRVTARGDSVESALAAAADTY